MSDDGDPGQRSQGFRIEGEQARLLVEKLKARMQQTQPSEQSAVEEVLAEQPAPASRVSPAHSEAVQDILGYVPHWIVRWGTTVVLSVILLLLIGSWFAKYPDVVTAPIEIVPSNPPVTIKARTTGKLQHLLVEDRQHMSQGAYLAVLESTVDYRAVLDLKPRLEVLRQLAADTGGPGVGALDLAATRALGELQADFVQLAGAVEEYREFIELEYHAARLRSVRAQITQTTDMLAAQRRQLDMAETELALVRQSHERNQTLSESGLISPTEWENSKGALLQKQYAAESARIGVISTENQLLQLQQTARDLEREQRRVERELRTAVIRAADNLRSRIQLWEQSSVIVAGVDGTVSLGRFWKENQNVAAGDVVATVIPETPGRLVGRVQLPLHGSGKVRSGQRVSVKLFNYPYEDYGVVPGVVESKALAAEGETQSATVAFPDGITTNVGIELPVTPSMPGTVEIVTDDVRLLERLLARTKTYLESGR